jgi:hypothetical protein
LGWSGLGGSKLGFSMELLWATDEVTSAMVSAISVAASGTLRTMTAFMVEDRIA